MTDPLASLLHASHLLSPVDLPAVVAEQARALGAVGTVLYLADYEQVTLLPLPGEGGPGAAGAAHRGGRWPAGPSAGWRRSPATPGTASGRGSRCSTGWSASGWPS